MYNQALESTRSGLYWTFVVQKMSTGKTKPVKAQHFQMCLGHLFQKTPFPPPGQDFTYENAQWKKGKQEQSVLYADDIFCQLCLCDWGLKAPTLCVLLLGILQNTSLTNLSFLPGYFHF